MSTMIERVVCAIQDSIVISDSGTVNCEAIARAVIREMREPTDAMWEAGEGFVQSEHAYQAMIDVALSESRT